MKIILMCDKCGKEGGRMEISENYDYSEMDLCKKCALEFELRTLEDYCKNKDQWLEDVFLKPLRVKKERLEKVREELSKS